MIRAWEQGPLPAGAGRELFAGGGVRSDMQMIAKEKPAFTDPLMTATGEVYRMVGMKIGDEGDMELPEADKSAARN